jgi:hypothetical protein
MSHLESFLERPKMGSFGKNAFFDRSHASITPGWAGRLGQPCVKFTHVLAPPKGLRGK